jgi:hypothetical protein
VDVAADACVVVVSRKVVEVVVEGALVDDVEAVAPIVLELPAVESGSAVEQETTSKAAPTAVERANETVRTGIDRISVRDSPRWSNDDVMRQHSPIDERHDMLFASAVPIRSGKTARYRDLATELKPHLEEYQGLNRRFEVQAHAYWINHGRDGDIGVSVYEISPAGLARMRLREWDRRSAHDRWWLEFVEDVNGLDLLQAPAHVAPPEPVFDWRED